MLHAWMHAEGMNGSHHNYYNSYRWLVNRANSNLYNCKFDSFFSPPNHMKGRPYREKMSLDRTEMLYWLQQERRKLLLRPVITSLDSMAIQPPISMQAQANLNMHS